MDKRTWIFFFTLMLSYILVNTYFSYQNQDKEKEWQQQQQAKKEQEKVKALQTIHEKTLPQDKIPAVSLYSDAERTNLVGWGLKWGNSIFLMPWTEILPENLYITGGETFHLTTEGAKIGTPALYTKEPTQKIKTKILPEFGNYDLQLVFLSSISSTPVSVYFGEYQNGRVTLPYQKLHENFPLEYKESIPSVAAIALMKVDNELIPVGTYSSASNTITPLYQDKTLSAYLSKVEAPKTIGTVEKEEKLYVLENGFQQFVFSNYGGSISEINLPFQSEKNPDSIVKEIEFDRQMVENHPQNALFPSASFYTAGDKKDGDFVYHEQGSLGGYYPLLRRNLIEKPPYQSMRINPNYYALNVVSEYPEVGETIYKVKYFDKSKIVFEAELPHRKITKTYSIDKESAKAPYTLTLSVDVEGDVRGLWITTGIPDAEWISGGIAPDLKYRMKKSKNESVVKSLSLPDPTFVDTSTYIDWICNSNGFLGLIVDPLGTVDPGYKAAQIPALKAPSRLQEIDEKYDRFKADQLPGYAMMLPLNSKGGHMEFRVYAGPFATSTLKAVDKAFSDPSTGYNPDYISCQSFHGYLTFISEPISKFLLVLMQGFYSFTNSWALSIILLTVALRIILYPFNQWSMKSMARMREVAPELAKIQEKYKKDPKRMQIETANLYREKGINPFSGCLPMLLQLPFLIGMFDLLKSTFELRGASFIPGWIDDLAAPDVVFSWAYPIFFIGNSFHLLPVLLGVIMFFQQKMSSTAPTDVKLMTDQQRQQQSMMSIMTVVFTVMFYHFPSGLNLYWLSSMLLGMLQQWWVNKRGAKLVAA